MADINALIAQGPDLEKVNPVRNAMIGQQAAMEQAMGDRKIREYDRQAARQPKQEAMADQEQRMAFAKEALPMIYDDQSNTALRNKAMELFGPDAGDTWPETYTGNEALFDQLRSSLLPKQAASYSGNTMVGDNGNMWAFNTRTGRYEDTGTKMGLRPDREIRYLGEAERTKKFEGEIGKREAEQQANVNAGMPVNPLPQAALNQVIELEDKAKIADNVSQMLDDQISKIENGQIRLGPVRNLLSSAKNWAGMSDADSRNLASLKANLEKMRNDSLRLNKGPQTDGDAERAWQELIANINDPQVVSQRMAEIKELNANAAEWHRQQSNMIKQNYGAAPASQVSPRQSDDGYQEGDKVTQGGRTYQKRNGQWVQI